MKLTLSYEYMSESYDQVRRYGSKWLLMERVVGAALVVLGAGLYMLVEDRTATSMALIAIGIFELLSNRIKKHFWLLRHSKSKLMNAEVELRITETGIESIGPYSSGQFAWSGMERVVRTPKGVLLWPQKGVYWYVPESIAGEQIIAEILAKTEE